MRKFVIVKDGIARIMEAQDYVDPLDEIKKWHPDDQAKVTSVREISESDIPVNRTVALRNAWEDNGTNITVNLVKARANKTDEIRPERNSRLAALDIDYIRADEAGDADKKQAIATVKQKLRDIPQTIQSDLGALGTPDALEKFTPTWPTEGE